MTFTTSSATTTTALKLSASKVTYGNEQTEHVSVTVSSQYAGSTPTGTVTVKDSKTTLCVIELSVGEVSSRAFGRGALGRYLWPRRRLRSERELRPLGFGAGIPHCCQGTIHDYPHALSRQSHVRTRRHRTRLGHRLVAVRRLDADGYGDGEGLEDDTVRDRAVGGRGIVRAFGRGALGRYLWPRRRLRWERELRPLGFGAGIPHCRKGTSTTALMLSAAKVTYGHEGTAQLSVTVSPQYAGSTPSGTVTVTQSTTTLCVITLSSGKGKCKLSPRKLKAGTYHLVATYGGSATSRPRLRRRRPSPSPSDELAYGSTGCCRAVMGNRPVGRPAVSTDARVAPAHSHSSRLLTHPSQISDVPFSATDADLSTWRQQQLESNSASGGPRPQAPNLEALSRPPVGTLPSAWGAARTYRSADEQTGCLSTIDNPAAIQRHLVTWRL